MANIPGLIPARAGTAVELTAGQAVKVVNTHGTQVVDTWAFNADDLFEFMSMEHFRADHDRLMPAPGDSLQSNHRRALLVFEEDSSPGVHDTLYAACDTYRYERLGCTEYHDNCTDNLRHALAAIGLRTPEIPCPLNLFMVREVQPDGTISCLPPVSRPGDHVVLRAAMDCIAVFSACPQDMVPTNGPDMTPVDAHYEIL